MKLNKKQKRTATIASMAALLAVVLGMGGQTFAKYITTHETGTQSATVAKWGYVVNSNVTKLFDTTYGTDSDSDDMLEAGTDGTSVVTTGSSSVVAPGTEGFMTLVISGKAEVLSSIKVSVADKAENLGSGVATAQDIYYGSYKPLKWTITNNGAATTVTDGELADVETYLEAIGTAHATVAANTVVDYDLEISWKWEFEQGADDAEKNENNGYDTRLGDLVALTEAEYNEKYGAGAYTTDQTNSSTKVSFAMKVTVEQIQE